MPDPAMVQAAFDYETGSSGLATPDLSTFPLDCVCYIVATYPDGTGLRGSGEIIGPHTVLTASHLLWDAGKNALATSVAVTPAEGLGGQVITGAGVLHAFQINDAGGTITQDQSQYDYAVIDVAANLSGYGAFGVFADYPGGMAHVTGYPASAGVSQVDRTGEVQANAVYHILDYLSLSVSPGDSGSPVWLNMSAGGAIQPEVVGVVSTTAWAVQLTAADLSTINGWEASDAWLWTSSGLTIHASSAAPVAQGGGGNDTLIGWDGADTLYGGAGADSIVGGAGFNSINGNLGDDTITGRSSVGDVALGGQGNDSLDASASTGANSLNGNLGDDTVVGGSGPDTLHGGQGDDVVYGGAGNDWISGDLGANSINGNLGDDTIVSAASAVDTMLGGQGNDSLDASAAQGGTSLNGNLGDDTLLGGAGSETLRGGQGDDVIHAGAGADWISGDLGSNTLIGGAGPDTFHAGAGHDQVSGWHVGDQVLLDPGVTFTLAQVGADAHIVLSTGGEMDLIGVQVASLQSGWIVGG